jgi:hypothetical protein
MPNYGDAMAHCTYKLVPKSKYDYIAAEAVFVIWTETPCYELELGEVVFDQLNNPNPAIKLDYAIGVEGIELICLEVRRLVAMQRDVEAIKKVKKIADDLAKMDGEVDQEIASDIYEALGWR